MHGTLLPYAVLFFSVMVLVMGKFGVRKGSDDKNVSTYTKTCIVLLVDYFRTLALPTRTNDSI
jgi:hypothetical protein